MHLPTRPFQIIVLAIFAVLALGGLALFANYTGMGNGTKSIGTVVIWGTLPQDAIETQVTALAGAHKEYANVSYVQKAAGTFDADLAEAIASGSGPDMILISQEDLASEQNKLRLIPFTSLPERTFTENYLPIDSLYLTDQGTYGIPLVVDPLVLYYNNSILNSSGVAAPPKTWEAITGLAAPLTTRAGGQITRSAIALGAYSNILNARSIISLILLQSNVGITSAGQGGLRSTLTSSPNGDTFGTSPAESAMSFYTQFADAAKTVYTWNPALPLDRQAFLSGDLAFYIGFASEEPYIAAGNPNLDFDMAPIPQPGTSTTRTTYGNAYAFAIPKVSANPDGAYQAATALSAKTQQLPIARALSMAPASRSLLAPAANDKFQAVYYPEALAAKAWLSPAPSVTDTIFSTMIGNITSGRLSARDALSKADQALTAAFQ